MKGGRTKSFGVLALFLITGAIFGGILGELIAGSSAFGSLTPYFAKSYSIVDIPPVTINLYVIKLVVGFALYPNLVSILGVVLAFILFRMF